MNKLSIYPPTLSGESVEQKRQEIKEYFLNTYTLYEKLFEVLKDERVFYEKSELTRHPMVFYFGHTATFFVNKLVNMKIINQRVNPDFESKFAVGVDEMSWDDMNSEHYAWPSIEEVRVYRGQVKELVLKLIDELPLTLPLSWDSDMWVIMMGIEHERIHIETSSVLHRQLPLEFVKNVEEFKVCDYYGESPLNSLVDISAKEISLGKNHDDNYYGWDNEYGEYSQHLQEFKASKYLVSNAEFMTFVQDGGYEKEEYWSEEGKEFLKTSQALHPTFWILEEGEYFYRTLSAKIEMPLNFPVDVNALEAEAFCKYKSETEGNTYLLPSEAEYEAICLDVGVNAMVQNEDANINLKYMSATPINTYDFFTKTGHSIYDVVGNVWQHSRSLMRPFDGFEIHEAYDDFTVPTFDEKHALILGSSWASSGNLIMKKSRYAFRKHFYQNAGFRYVVSSNDTYNHDISDDEDIYETDDLVSQYCEFQYGSDSLGVKNFAIECAKIAVKYSKNTRKALDLGCATGRASFELAKTFDEVEGIDFSIRFVGVGSKLKDDGSISWHAKTEGALREHKDISIEELGYSQLKEKVSFWQGDACNIRPNFTGYDAIMATNLIDRLYNPSLFLDTIDERLNDDGILMITSPYTWQEESTKSEFWLGGYVDENGAEVKTIERLKQKLSAKFDLVHLQDLEFVIKETDRKYQHTISEVSVWRKK